MRACSGGSRLRTDSQIHEKAAAHVPHQNDTTVVIRLTEQHRMHFRGQLHHRCQPYSRKQNPLLHLLLIAPPAWSIYKSSDRVLYTLHDAVLSSESPASSARTLYCTVCTVKLHLSYSAYPQRSQKCKMRPSHKCEAGGRACIVHNGSRPVHYRSIGGSIGVALNSGPTCTVRTYCSVPEHASPPAFRRVRGNAGEAGAGVRPIWAMSVY